jgi:plastocyanin
MLRLQRLLAAGLLLATAACGGGGSDDGPTQPNNPNNPNPGNPNPGTPSTTNAIAVRDNSFEPNATTVTPGTTVTWTWNGNNQHNVTFADGTASGTQAAGTFTRTFAAAGTFNYTCTVHGSGMSGTITVR